MKNDMERKINTSVNGTMAQMDVGDTLTIPSSKIASFTSAANYLKLKLSFTFSRKISKDKKELTITRTA